MRIAILLLFSAIISGVESSPIAPCQKDGVAMDLMVNVTRLIMDAWIKTNNRTTELQELKKILEIVQNFRYACDEEAQQKITAFFVELNKEYEANGQSNYSQKDINDMVNLNLKLRTALQEYKSKCNLPSTEKFENAITKLYQKLLEDSYIKATPEEQLNVLERQHSTSETSVVPEGSGETAEPSTTVPSKSITATEKKAGFVPLKTEAATAGNELADEKVETTSVEGFLVRCLCTLSFAAFFVFVLFVIIVALVLFCKRDK